ncbi:MAG: uroporphyrinogen-III synthase [Chloroflexota bacterium]
MSLQGRLIVVTRATDQADSLIDAIEAADGKALRFPCIELLPPENPAPMDAALRNISHYNWVLFTSANAVRAIVQRVKTLGITIDWSKLRIGAVGEKTDRAIHSYLGRHADVIPEEHLGTALASALPLLGEEYILIPQSTLADESLASALRDRDAHVTTLEAYTMGQGIGGDDIRAYLQAQNIDALTFTSGSTVTNFIDRIAPQTAWQVPTICIGPSTQAIADERGFQKTHHPDDYTVEAMVDLLQNIFD